MARRLTESGLTACPRTRPRTLVATSRLSLGNTSNVKWFSGIGEYRIDWGPGYRVYLAKDGDGLIVLYGGGTKKSQSKDIERAVASHAEYKARKAAAKSREKRKPQGR